MVNLDTENRMSRLLGPAVVVIDDVKVRSIFGGSIVRDTGVLKTLEQIDRTSRVKSPGKVKMMIPIEFAFN